MLTLCHWHYSYKISKFHNNLESVVAIIEIIYDFIELALRYSLKNEFVSTV